MQYKVLHKMGAGVSDAVRVRVDCREDVKQMPDVQVL